MTDDYYLVAQYYGQAMGFTDATALIKKAAKNLDENTKKHFEKFFAVLDEYADTYHGIVKIFQKNYFKKINQI